MTFLTTLLSGVSQGLCWALLTLGVYITYRLLDFADLSVEGTFPLGAAVTAVLINAGVNPFLAILAALACGMLAGFCTGFLNTVCKIPPILSGILTMIALYSINLRIQAGKATVTFKKDSVKNLLSGWFSKLLHTNVNEKYISIGIGVCFALLAIILLYFFFGTEIGAAIRATGNNPFMARALGVNTSRMTVLGLMLSNGLIAASGSLYAQLEYNAAIVTMGQGAIVIGLAAVIIGEVLFCHKDHSFAYRMTAVVLGAVIYYVILAFALKVNFLNATDLKLITAVIVTFALSLPVIKGFIADRRERAANRRQYADGGADHA